MKVSTSRRPSNSLSSGYSLQFNWQLSGQELAATGQQRASRRAVDADINNAGEQLRNDIAFQYLSALQAVATTEVNRQSVIRNLDQLQLAPIPQVLVGLALVLFGRKLFWLFVGVVGFLAGMRFGTGLVTGQSELAGGALSGSGVG